MRRTCLISKGVASITLIQLKRWVFAAKLPVLRFPQAHPLLYVLPVFLLVDVVVRRYQIVLHVLRSWQARAKLHHYLIDTLEQQQQSPDRLSTPASDRAAGAGRSESSPLVALGFVLPCLPFAPGRETLQR